MDEGKDRIGPGNGSTAIVPDRGAALDPPRKDTGAGGEQTGAHADGRLLSTRELVSRILKTGSRLVSKEIELARAEVMADLAAELAMIKMLAAAAVGALLGVNLLLVAAVFALTHWMPGWLAALVLGGIILGASAVVGYVGWQRRVTSPLAVTRKALTEDLQWVKERIA
jgi:uncharacterized membrane protein YqjE